MEPLVLLGREVRPPPARKAPWRLALVPGRTVVLAEHGFPELAGVTLVDGSSVERPDAPMRAEYAEGAPRLTAENVFAVGKQRFELSAFRSWAGKASRPVGPKVLAAIQAVRANDGTPKRLVLADVLEEDGARAEAEYVRQELQLLTIYDPKGPRVLEQLTAFLALSAEVGVTFRCLVGRDVGGCAGPQFTLRCQREWHELLRTDDPRLGFCDRCAKPLAIAEDDDEAAGLEAEGRCVSFTNYLGAPR